MTRLRLTLLGAALAPLALAGCVTLFPKSRPVTLYRFEADLPAAAQNGGPPLTVRLGPASFDQTAAGHQIMTVTGEQVAYLSGARWAAPAQDLFDAAVDHGFNEAGGRAHLMRAGAPGHANLALQISVTRFEADYLSGPTSPPTVVVRLRAQLARESGMVAIGAQEFDVRVPATQNRVGAIVRAFNQATTKAIGSLIDWVDSAAS